eukprot:7722824-Ditylum_brightwellii.AAC.1
MMIMVIMQRSEITTVTPFHFIDIHDLGYHDSVLDTAPKHYFHNYVHLMRGNFSGNAPKV